MDAKDLGEQLWRLRDHQHTPEQKFLIDEARNEITRLRASQFRWIPVGEKMPGGRYLVAYRGQVEVWNGVLNAAEIGATHWAPIPPLPEKSQEEKDEELWMKWADSHNSLDGAKDYFLAGLKAAREQKP